MASLKLLYNPGVQIQGDAFSLLKIRIYLKFYQETCSFAL